MISSDDEVNQSKFQWIQEFVEYESVWVNPNNYRDQLSDNWNGSPT